MSELSETPLFLELARCFTDDFSSDLENNSTDLQRVAATVEVCKIIGVNPEVVRQAREAGFLNALGQLSNANVVIKEI